MKEMPTDDPLFGKGSVRADGRKIHPAYLFEVKKPQDSNVGLLQSRCHHPGGGSLHPARQERLPDAEEELSTATSDDVTKPSPGPGRGLLHAPNTKYRKQPHAK